MHSPLHVPATWLSPAELRAAIRAAGLESYRPAFRAGSCDAADLDPRWLPTLAAIQARFPTSDLLGVVDLLVNDTSGVLDKVRPGLTAEIQICYALEEARREVLARQPFALRYRMPTFQALQWMQAAGISKLAELTAGELGLADRAPHRDVDLSHLIAGDYRGAPREMDVFTRELMEVMFAFAARRVRDAAPLPELPGAGPGVLNLRAALITARDGLLVGVTGFSNLLRCGEIQVDLQRLVFSVSSASWRLWHLSGPAGEVRVTLQHVAGGRLVAHGEASGPPPLRALLVAALITRLLRVYLPTLGDLSALEQACQPNPWRQVLAELAEQERALTPDDSASALGWRVRMGGIGVEAVDPVRVTPLKRGDGVRLAGVEGTEAAQLAGADGDEQERIRAWSTARAAAWPRFVYDLAGHRRVFAVPSGASASAWLGPLPVVRRRLRLRLQRDGDSVVFVLPDGGPYWFELRGLADADERDQLRVRLRPDASAIECVRMPQRLYSVFRSLAKVEGRFPREALPDLVARVPMLARDCDLEVDDGVASQVLEPDMRLHLRLERQGHGLRVDAAMVAIPGGAPWAPGVGPEVVYASTGDGLLMSRRRPLEERAAWEQLAVRLAPGAPNDEGVLQLESTEAALAAIAVLRDAPGVTVTWSGRQVRLHRAAAGNLRVSVRSGVDWFAVDGLLRVEGLTVELREALAALRGGAVFIPMRDGEWVELESDLRSVLQAMSRALPVGPDGPQVGPLHTPLLGELEHLGASVEGAAWRELAGRLEEAAALPVEVPEGMSLRPYQEEGFRWMCRLSHWGAGAVLADDMGLGKTVQAIAWLRHHAAHGPALVVCPTSVCSNWLAELERFAPMLDRRLFYGEDRAHALAGLGPGAVVVTTYHVATRELEALQAAGWSALVLDEAHVIKNAASQRSKAILALQAPRRLALTGTPIENHVGELWAVLTAVAPGLLGPLEAFRDRFMVSQQDEARQALAKLIRPFILRRLKRDVATDLPPRTDILVPITLSAGERAFYHNIREAAVREIGSSDVDAPQVRMHVLAALTRLRRAACDPRLIDPGLALPSSKLAALDALLEPLVESGHRVLVFSQFTGLLDRVRAGLEHRGVAYRSLDGSTPAARRGAEIAAFQAGEAPVFLLSLKAGGVGLNLTAADTVIHLDPWWNPAVEDQATDRAHRMGQTQPVTVYRLVTRGTVEEKILALHASKRELANSLLEGTGAAGKLGIEELMELLREAAAVGWEEEGEVG